MPRSCFTTVRRLVVCLLVALQAGTAALGHDPAAGSCGHADGRPHLHLDWLTPDCDDHDHEDASEEPADGPVVYLPPGGLTAVVAVSAPTSAGENVAGEAEPAGAATAFVSWPPTAVALAPPGANWLVDSRPVRFRTTPLRF